MFVDNDTVCKNHICQFFISLGVLNKPKLRYIWRINFMFVAFHAKSSQFLIVSNFNKMNMLRVLLSHLAEAPRRYAPSKLNLDVHHTITESHKFSRGSVFKVDIYSRNKWIEFTKARCTPRNERSFIIERLIRGFLSKVSQRADGRWIVGVRCVRRERLLSRQCRVLIRLLRNRLATTRDEAVD